jgi:hypothetical protein
MWPVHTPRVYAHLPNTQIMLFLREGKLQPNPMSGGKSDEPMSVPVGYSNSNVPMVKPTQDRQAEHASGRRAESARPSSARSAYDSRCNIVAKNEQMTKMLLAKDDDVIEAVPPDRSEQPLRESIIKRSQLRLFRLIERGPSRSLMFARFSTGLIVPVTRHVTRTLAAWSAALALASPWSVANVFRPSPSALVILR